MTTLISISTQAERELAFVNGTGELAQAGLLAAILTDARIIKETEKAILFGGDDAYYRAISQCRKSVGFVGVWVPKSILKKEQHGKDEVYITPSWFYRKAAIIQ